MITRLDPLSFNVPLVDASGLPTPEFLRKWQQLSAAATTVSDLSARRVIAGPGLTGGGVLSADVTLAADVQAVLDQLRASQGSLIYRGDNVWRLLTPGTASQVLTTGGPAADPSWQNAAPTVPVLTHNHVFIGTAGNVAGDVALSGDATVSDTGTLTLAASGVVAASYGDASHYTTFTVDAKGRLTAATSVAVPAGVSPANPTAQVGGAAVNGVAATFMRSDAAPKLADTAVTPTTYGDSTHYATFTVDQQGRLTAASQASLPATPTGANPTATASDAAVNGVATTFMRSDGAPAVQKTSSSAFGLAKVDGTTITASAGVISAAGASGANPTATVSAAAVNGVAVTFMRSDAAPALAAIANDTILSNNSGGSTGPVAQSLDTILSARGGIAYSVAGAGTMIQQQGEGACTFSNAAYSTTNNALYALRRARGTIATPAVPNTGDNLGLLRWAGWISGTTFGTGAEIRATVREATWAPTTRGTKLAWWIAKLGASALTEAMDLDADNGLSLGGVNVISAAGVVAESALTVQGGITPGSYGSASQSLQATVDSHGVLTALSAVAITTGAAGDGSIARFTATVAQPGFDPTMIFGAAIVLSGSNKIATPASSSPYNYCYGTTARYTGKRYWEVVPGSTSFCSIGAVGAAAHIVDLGNNSVGNLGQRYPGGVGWTSDGKVSAVNVPTGSTLGLVLATYATWSASNVLCFALNIDNMLMWFRVGAGNWNNNASANPATNTLGLSVNMLLSSASNGLVWPGMNLGNTSATTLRLLAADFTQTLPSGFTGWAN